MTFMIKATPFIFLFWEDSHIHTIELYELEEHF